MSSRTETTAHPLLRTSAHPVPAGSAIVNQLRRAVLFFTLVLPWLAWPGLDHPFSSPKLVAWMAFTGLALIILALKTPAPGPRLPAMLRSACILWVAALGASAAWNAPVSLSALALPLCGAAWFFVVVALRPRVSDVAVRLAAAAGVVGAWALLQFLDLDPWMLFGYFPDAANARARVYSTLGNPNFVAAFLVAALPLTAALPSARLRRTKPLLIALEAAGLFATGSRAAVLGLAAAALVAVASSRSSRRCISFAAGCAALAFAILAFSPARPLATTLHGRVYVWRVAAPHLRDSPLFGFGPGAVQARYPEWEDDWWRSHAPSPADRVFAAAHDHTHNDYLEIALETGWPGLGAFLALVFLVLGTAWKPMRGREPGLLHGAVAGIAALCAVALVDFPFHRPAELFLFWTLAALASLQIQSGNEEPGQKNAGPPQSLRKEPSYVE
jgi:O-antigen ligase